MSASVDNYLTMPLTRDNIKRILESHNKNNQELLNSSVQKNIIAFIGNTGSGKSTLINSLIEKDLIVDKYDNVVLRDPNDQSAMRIGVTSVSETHFPKFFEYKNQMFYDFPGLNDTRGPIVSLVNAAFIKNIIEKALTVKIVFVVSKEEIMAVRGEAVKHLVKATKNLLNSESIENVSALIVNKSWPKKNIQLVVEMLRQKTDGEIVSRWYTAERLGKMEAPNDHGVIRKEDRDEILEAISRIQAKSLCKVNIGAIFNRYSF